MVTVGQTPQLSKAHRSPIICSVSAIHFPLAHCWFNTSGQIRRSWPGQLETKDL